MKKKHVFTALGFPVLFVFFMCFASPSLAQKKFIRGNVMDVKGTPMYDVRIYIDGEETRTRTNSNGFYKIRLKMEADSIGFYSKEIGMKVFAVEGKSEINFTYAYVTKQYQSESHNIGYGQQSRSTSTNSVSTISDDATDFSQYSDIWAALAGRVPGLEIRNVGGEVTMVIRGAHTALGNSQPLILLDGIPITNLNMINPNNVQSVDVIKDGTTAIYGMEGANGVILITTKKAK